LNNAASHLVKLQAEVARQTPKSVNLFERAQCVLPGGVGSDAKFREPSALFIAEAQGSRFMDVDGNEYVDYRQSAGATLLGHSHPAVVEAICEQSRRHINTMQCNVVEVEVAEKLTRHVPAFAQVRFANSATEANMMALRAARAFTGRDLIAKFEGHYLGQHDDVLYSGFRMYGGDPARPDAIVESPGIPRAKQDDVVILPTNRPEETLRRVAELGDRLACVFFEPVKETWFGGPQPGFLAALLAVCQQVGALLIFDEAVSSLRWGLGGAQTLWEVTPDISVGGKALSNGLPVGSWGGRRDIMDAVVRPHVRLMEIGSHQISRKIYASGTFTGNGVSMGAANATLTEMEQPGLYARINGLGDKMRGGLGEVIARHGLPMHVTGVGSIVNIHFTPEPLRDMRDTGRANAALMQCFEAACLLRGIFIITQQGFISAAHTEAEIDAFLNVADAVGADLAPLV